MMEELEAAHGEDLSDGNKSAKEPTMVSEKNVDGDIGSDGQWEKEDEEEEWDGIFEEDYGKDLFEELTDEVDDDVDVGNVGEVGNVDVDEGGMWRENVDIDVDEGGTGGEGVEDNVDEGGRGEEGVGIAGGVGMVLRLTWGTNVLMLLLMRAREGLRVLMLTWGINTQKGKMDARWKLTKRDFILD